MRYNDDHALEVLRRQLEGRGPAYEEFLVLEARSVDNRHRSLVFGTTDARSSELSETRYALNRLASEHLGVSFSDLALGRLPGVGIETPRVAAAKQNLDREPAPGEIRPPVETRPQLLPLAEISWEQFELLCASLVAAFHDVVDCHLYGVRGNDQKGIDIVATLRSRDRQETWVFQCKQRHQRYTSRELEEALAKITYGADFHVVMLSREATTALRDVVARQVKTFLWDAQDLSRKLKNYPGLVEDFFGPNWRQAFCGTN